MKATNVHPIIFNFSNSQFNDKTEGDYVRFLNELFFVFNIQSNCNREHFFVSNFDKNHFSKDNPTELRDFFRNSLVQKKIINVEPDTIQLTSGDTIVIDIANEDTNLESRNLKLFLTYITQMLIQWDKNHNEIALVIIANRVFSLEDFPNEEFFELVKNNKIVLFDYKGHSSFAITSHNPSLAPELLLDYSIKIKEVFKKHHKLIFGDHLEKFKKKLVGYVGHFARELESDIDRCHFYFYDGIHCEKELKEILIAKIKLEEPDFIIVDCRESPWLFPPVYRAISDLADRMKIDIFLYDEQLEIISGEVSGKKTDERNKIKSLRKDSKGIILFDLIHRGNRLAKVINDLKELNSELHLKIHTVIRAVNDTNLDKPNEAYSINGFDVLPYHVVKQIDERHSNCPYCNQYEIPHNSKEDLDSIELSTPNFWMLCKESKYIPEKDTPTSYRSPLRAVPDFQKMLKENGAFLALKVKEVLMRKLNLTESQLSNITLIGPNEDGTKEISMCLSYFMDVELILIDKTAVKLAQAEDFDRNKILTTFANEWWCSSINNIIGSSKPKEAIIFDDFSITKNTLESYHDFMKKLGFKVSAFFPIFKFNCIDFIDATPIYSLYNFDLSSSHYNFNSIS